MAQKHSGTSNGIAPACEHVPYQETTDPQFGQQAARTFTALRETDETITLAGSCPRCNGAMKVDIPDEVFLASRTGRLQRLLGRPDRTTSPAAGEGQEVPIICLCRATHPGRPENRKGCGAYWNLIVGDPQ
jgi:hypothetical protein